MKSTTAQEYTSWRDEEEREHILLQQMPQVHYIARRIRERLPRHIALEDLIHAGVLGLIDALNKYDQSKHVQFSSYAKFRIRGAILDSLREMDWSPRELRRKARKVQDTYNGLSTRLGRSPNESEMADALGVSLREFQDLLAELDGLEIGSLHLCSPRDGSDEDLCEFLPSAPEETPFFICLRSEMRRLLAQSISELPEKERQVLSLYYFEELTMKEVGELLRIGESRVSQIHSMAVIRLRSRLQKLLESGSFKAASAGAP
jgi:RNA polymerase sigma factor for flagellar operon FliA